MSILTKHQDARKTLEAAQSTLEEAIEVHDDATQAVNAARATGRYDIRARAIQFAQRALVDLVRATEAVEVAEKALAQAGEALAQDLGQAIRGMLGHAPLTIDDPVIGD